MPRKSPQKNPNNLLELKLLKEGFEKVIGIDEVGRGAFAGPVYVGAFIYTLDTKILEGVRDSKLLSKIKRESISEHFSSEEYLIKIGSVESINKIGIGATINKLIKEVYQELNGDDVFFLIDGYFKENFGQNTLQIKGGDNLHFSISCASIVAKVLRDNFMYQQARLFPEYGFEKNVGYGTATHIDAIKKHGITPIHRTSFGPIGRIYEQTRTRENNRN